MSQMSEHANPSSWTVLRFDAESPDSGNPTISDDSVHSKEEKISSLMQNRAVEEEAAASVAMVMAATVPAEIDSKNKEEDEEDDWVELSEQDVLLPAAAQHEVPDQQSVPEDNAQDVPAAAVEEHQPHLEDSADAAAEVEQAPETQPASQNSAEEDLADQCVAVEEHEQAAAESPSTAVAAETVLVDAPAPTEPDAPPVPYERNLVERQCDCLGGPYGFHREDCKLCSCVGASIGLHHADCPYK